MREWFVRFGGPAGSNPKAIYRIQESVGGPNAWLDIYGAMSLNKFRFFAPAMFERLGDHIPYDDLGLNLDRARRWHPLNRSLYLGARVHLAGHLLASKGDRVAMHSSVETRYPFLDENVFAYLARVNPRWKLRGLREKYLLRRMAERWLPASVAWRPKLMFRSPFDSFHAEQLPPFVEQLLSEESLRKTGYFESANVRHWGQAFRQMRAGSFQRTMIEMGLVGVVATQLWHHTFIDPTLADLPSMAGESSAAHASGDGRYGGSLSRPASASLR
jgi:asparagine synthase (glutamine-hydrolysing)